MLHISELPGDTDTACPWVTETCMSLVSNSRAEAVQGPFWMNSCQDDQQGTFWRNPGRSVFLPHTKTTYQEARAPLAFPSPGRVSTGASARVGAVVEKLAFQEGFP